MGFNFQCLVWAVGFSFVIGPSALAASAPNAEVKGERFQQISVSSCDVQGVTIVHVNGVCRIPWIDIDSDQLRMLERIAGRPLFRPQMQIEVGKKSSSPSSDVEPGAVSDPTPPSEDLPVRETFTAAGQPEPVLVSAPETGSDHTFGIVLSIYAALLLAVIMIHQAGVITVFTDYTDAAFSLGTVASVVVASMIFSSTTSWVAWITASGVVAFGIWFTVRAARLANVGLIRTVAALAAKVILSVFAFGMVVFAFSSVSSKRRDDSEEDQSVGIALALLAITLAAGAIRLCTRCCEFTSLTTYLGSEGADVEEEPEEPSFQGEAAPEIYQVLGCSPQDSADLVRRRYRELAKQYHPDTLSGRGLPHDCIEFASSRFRGIQQAYEEIQLERRWR